MIDWVVCVHGTLHLQMIGTKYQTCMGLGQNIPKAASWTEVGLLCQQELAGLKGTRAAISLFLEAADVATPLIRAAFAAVADVLTFLLTRLIGRALGLIYYGIRQSLAPQGRQRIPQEPAGSLP